MGGRGLHSVYSGCRCEDCLARQSQAPTTRLNRGAIHTNNKDGYLQVECWCQRSTVKVRASDVRKGRTGCCKSFWCRPPEKRPQ
jgi:hypothetical protein